MTDQHYSNREIDLKHEMVMEKLEAILEQAKKTNGRVTDVEKWVWLLKGAFGFITIVVLPIIFLLINNRL